MPWKVEQGAGDCDGYAVIKEADGSIAGCHPSEEEAKAQVKALYATAATAIASRLSAKRRTQEARARRIAAKAASSLPLHLPGQHDQAAHGGDGLSDNAKADAADAARREGVQERVEKISDSGVSNMTSEQLQKVASAQITDVALADFAGGVEAGGSTRLDFKFKASDVSDDEIRGFVQREAQHKAVDLSSATAERSGVLIQHAGVGANEEDTDLRVPEGEVHASIMLGELAGNWGDETKTADGNDAGWPMKGSVSSGVLIATPLAFSAPEQPAALRLHLPNTDEHAIITAAGAPAIATPLPSSATKDADTALPSRFEAVLLEEGVTTSDDRFMRLGSIGWREVPIPLTNAISVGEDHYGEVIGAIDEVYRVDNSREGINEVRARGWFDLDSAAGREAARLVAKGLKRGVSVDLEVLDADAQQLDVECDGLLEPCPFRLEVASGRIMGAALVAFPAFPRAVLVPDGTLIPEGSDDGRPFVAAPLRLTAAGVPIRPPADWFENPGLKQLTPLTVSEDGQVFGHAAGWGTCHIGIQGTCVTAPRTRNNYNYFMTGEVECDCTPPQKISVGQLTLVGGHAPDHATAQAAVAHYDDTRSAVADVRVGEDAHGIWVAGALRPGVTRGQVRTLRASSLSGDWRRINGGLELVAICSVNTPGFPIPRAVVASGVQVSLVAAGAVSALHLPGQHDQANHGGGGEVESARDAGVRERGEADTAGKAAAESSIAEKQARLDEIRAVSAMDVTVAEAAKNAEEAGQLERDIEFIESRIGHLREEADKADPTPPSDGRTEHTAYFPTHDVLDEVDLARVDKTYGTTSDIDAGVVRMYGSPDAVAQAVENLGVTGSDVRLEDADGNVLKEESAYISTPDNDFGRLAEIDPEEYGLSESAHTEFMGMLESAQSELNDENMNGADEMLADVAAFLEQEATVDDEKLKALLDPLGVRGEDEEELNASGGEMKTITAAGVEDLIAEVAETVGGGFTVVAEGDGGGAVRVEYVKDPAKADAVLTGLVEKVYAKKPEFTAEKVGDAVVVKRAGETVTAAIAPVEFVAEVQKIAGDGFVATALSPEEAVGEFSVGVIYSGPEPDALTGLQTNVFAQKPEFVTELTDRGGVPALLVGQVVITPVEGEGGAVPALPGVTAAGELPPPVEQPPAGDPELAGIEAAIGAAAGEGYGVQQGTLPDGTPCLIISKAAPVEEPPPPPPAPEETAPAPQGPPVDMSLRQKPVSQVVKEAKRGFKMKATTRLHLPGEHDQANHGGGGGGGSDATKSTRDSDAANEKRREGAQERVKTESPHISLAKPSSPDTRQKDTIINDRIYMGGPPARAEVDVDDVTSPAARDHLQSIADKNFVEINLVDRAGPGGGSPVIEVNGGSSDVRAALLELGYESTDIDELELVKLQASATSAPVAGLISRAKVSAVAKKEGIGALVKKTPR